jgi:pSer/pThr/pTyr-binding forkhead associated (FHA) protein
MPAFDEVEGTRLQDPGDWDIPMPIGTAKAPQIDLPNQVTLVLVQTNAPYILSGKQQYLIGREDAQEDIFPDLDLSLSGGLEGGVSRKHARLFYENGAYWLQDLDSVNYTFVNETRLDPDRPHRLQDNDVIWFGNVQMRFLIGQHDMGLWR